MFYNSYPVVININHKTKQLKGCINLNFLLDLGEIESSEESLVCFSKCDIFAV